MLQKNKNLLLLHAIVFIWGWSPILGKLINIEGIGAYQLVWFRILITVISILIYLKLTKKEIKIPFKDLLILFSIGGIVAAHWYFFYNAINVSNVSVTLVAFSTGTLFISIVEPIFYKRKIIPYEIAFGSLIIGAISMIFKIETKYTQGIIFGVLAALTSSFFTVFNGLLVKRISSSLIALYELGGGLVALTIYLVFNKSFDAAFFTLSDHGLIWISILAIVATAFPFIASVNLMKSLSPFTVTLTVNLESVYGIVFAFFLWKDTETMTPGFYIGAAVILLVVFGNGILKQYLKTTQ